MVCDRCKMAVETVLEKLTLTAKKVTLGEVELVQHELSDEKYLALKETLENLGFELLEDKRKALVAQIKAAIVALAHYNKEPLKVNLSDYLSEKLAADYATLSSVFSAEEKILSSIITSNKR